MMCLYHSWMMVDQIKNLNQSKVATALSSKLQYIPHIIPFIAKR